jgi:hypothetical protein
MDECCQADGWTNALFADPLAILKIDAGKSPLGKSIFVTELTPRIRRIEA